MSKGTTIRNVRVSDELWKAALALAEKEQTSVSEVVRDLLQAWVTGQITVKGSAHPMWRRR
jgi:predicted HicB family RNase H-like nuclease